MPWIQIKLGTTDKKAEKIAGMLSGFGAASVTYMDTIDNPVYEPLPGETKLWTNTTVIGLFDADTDTDRIIKFFYDHFGDKITYKVEQLEDKDWVREWMDNFHPIKCGEKLWICPSWLEVEEKDSVVIKLDPGMAFGTGTHPTTALCLEYLDSIDLKGKQVLDYGCGSGILAISALKLGAENALGIDIEEQAIIASKENATRNCVAERLELFMDPKEMEDKPLSPVTVANILAGPLSMLEPAIASLTAKGGLLALSGILTEQADEVLKTYEKDFDMNPIKELNGWALLTGVRK